MARRQAADDRPLAVVRVVVDTGHDGSLRPPRPWLARRSRAAARCAARPGARSAGPSAGRRDGRCWPAPRSFCAGVERAIEIVERALDRYGRAGLRAPPDRPQRPRRRRPRAARRGLRRRARRGARTARRSSSRRHGVAPRCARRPPAREPRRDRRHLPAGGQGPPRGAPVRRARRLPIVLDRPRRARGGRGHARRGARTASMWSSVPTRRRPPRPRAPAGSPT